MCFELGNVEARLGNASAKAVWPVRVCGGYANQSYSLISMKWITCQDVSDSCFGAPDFVCLPIASLYPPFLLDNSVTFV